MKRFLCLVLATASLGGCVVLPAEPAYRADYGYVAPPVVVAPTWSAPYRGYGWGGRHGHGYRHGRSYRGW